jgi:Uma2 family endonuclease
MTRTATPRRADRKVAAPAAAAPLVPVDALGDGRFVISGLSWEGYVAINDAVVEHAGLKMIYCDGRLTLLTESRKHGLNSRCLLFLVAALAEGLEITWDVAASATFRRRKKRGGVEGDETFYFGEHAEIMKGSKDIDLNVQPPPDLAIEVEVSHSADDAVIVWGRLGVPEVWRFDPVAWECSFWKRRRNGTYARIDRSVAFPILTPADVVEQMRLADELGMTEWHARLGRWVRKVIVPRTRGGGTSDAAR